LHVKSKSSHNYQPPETVSIPEYMKAKELLDTNLKVADIHEYMLKQARNQGISGDLVPTRKQLQNLRNCNNRKQTNSSDRWRDLHKTFPDFIREVTFAPGKRVILVAKDAIKYLQD
jgi:hypothetical protein